MRQLTELDYCVLGVIWRDGPMSSYAVRKVFHDSTTAAWSSSSGSIYPSIRRLIEAGLVTGGAPQDRRKTRVVNITGAGYDRLQDWLRDVRPDLGTATPDPIRTRVQFLTALRTEERDAFVAAARRVSEAAVRELEAHAVESAANSNNSLDVLCTVGAMREVQARLSWLHEVTVHTEGRPTPRSGQ